MIRQAVILVGGRGSRLGTMTEVAPKPLLDVGGRPFLDYVIENFLRFGINDIILLAGYLGEQMVRYAERMAGPDITITCLIDPTPLGTAGALRHAESYLHEQFFVCNGDTFFDINLLDMELEHARHSEHVGVMALRGISDVGRYSVATLSGDRISGFGERGISGAPGVINGGLYVLRREVLQWIDGPSSLEADVFPRLAAQSRLLGKVYDRFFLDIGIPHDFAMAQETFPQCLRRPAAFLDRDGVLNDDHGYVHRPEQFVWTDGAPEAIKLLNDHGYLVLVVTNQAGVARGYYDETAVHALHSWIDGELRGSGAHIDAYYYCPHHPEGAVPLYAQHCECRKPGPGMLQRALQDWDIDLARSFLIGDKTSDLEAAQTVGLQGHIFAQGSLFDIVSPLVYNAPAE